MIAAAAAVAWLRSFAWNKLFPPLIPFPFWLNERATAAAELLCYVLITGRERRKGGESRERKKQNLFSLIKLRV